MKTPAQHIAIIMDGNGRWAKSRGHSRLWGHVRGARVARDIIELSAEMGLKNLTLFAFSSENWKRPEHEVSFLMKLLRRQLIKETEKLVKNNIRFSYVGDLSKLPDYARDTVLQTIEATAACSGLRLTFALSYGGRQEITTTVQQLARRIEEGELTSAQINEELISHSLKSSFLPDPDLIIRTSGENRLSNFLLWQAAYSEFEFTPVLWPDFNEKEYRRILDDFSCRERRFGQTSEQVQGRHRVLPELTL